MDVSRIDSDQDGLAAILSAAITTREKLDEVASELISARVTRVRSPMISMEMLSSKYTGIEISLYGSAKLKTDAGSASLLSGSFWAGTRSTRPSSSSRA